MSKRNLRLVENKKKKKNRYGLKFALGILILFIAVSIFVAVYFSTEKIKISGNDTYTQDEVLEAVKSKRYLGNTLVMTVKNRLMEEKYLPFIDSVTMSFEDPHILQIQITEKTRAGAIKQGKGYLYFNFAGTIVEKKSELFDGVPLVEDLDLDTVRLDQKIPVSKDMLNQITSLTRGLANYGLDVSEIHFNDNGEIILQSGEYEILIGNTDYLDAKLSKVPEVLKSIESEYKSGTIDMSLYTDENEIITYYK